MKFRRFVPGLLLLAAAAAPAAAQTPPTVTLPPIRVTAQKEPADVKDLPVSVTAVMAGTIDRAGIDVVSDAAVYAPNVFFSELTARKISNATFRGIGSSPANAGVTSVIDGVPQLNTNSSSLTFRDIEQVEFVRGPQSALFGRNSLGGVVNISSRRPQLNAWGGQLVLPIASSSGRALRGHASGPVRSGKVAVGGAFEYGTRDGFTTNTVTGRRVDTRDSFSAKGQVLFVPARAWEGRVILAGQRDRDGDYTLGDLDGIRRKPFEVARDFEGHTSRDVFSTTVLAQRKGPRLTFSSTTGIVKWRTEDATDLDYSPAPMITRDNTEDAVQFTQELRFASPSVPPSGGPAMRWQAGVFFFTQHYTQNAVNHFAPYVLSPFLPLAVDQQSPKSALDDHGVGVFGQGTLVLNKGVEIGFGARVDHESKSADLSSAFTPPIVPPTVVDVERGFTAVSPQVSVAFQPRAGHTLYASVAKGFKAGGFNPASPAGSEAYGEEGAWHVEGGWKSALAGGRVLANAAVFAIDWQDLQLNTPNPSVPGQFYIASVGAAASRGVEFELTALPHPNVRVFGALGYTRARFGAGSFSGGADVSGLRLPNAPEHTTMVGVEVTRPVGPASWFVRAESVTYGSFKYDPSNAAGQDAYSLANLRAGFRRAHFIADVWVRNAFDTQYVPIAFPYPQLAPSGYIGEPGRPRTFGVSVGVTF